MDGIILVGLMMTAQVDGGKLTTISDLTINHSVIASSENCELMKSALNKPPVELQNPNFTGVVSFVSAHCIFPEYVGQ